MVTVIIPVYNKVKYLRRCLQSVLAQSYGPVEMIVIDDCSTDASAALVEKITAGVPGCRLIRNAANIGHLKTRYIGVDQAQGEYVVFLDADDWMASGALEKMVSAMETFDADLVQIRYQRVLKGLPVKYQERFDRAMAERRIEGEEFRALASYVGMTSYIYPACWGKLYRTAKLREAQRIEFRQFWGEDQIFNIQYLRECRSMAFVDYVGYNYRWGGQTTSEYKYSALREYKHVHQFKRMMGQDEASINAEIILLLRYYVRSLMTELGFTRQATEMVMVEELRDPLWARVGMTMTAAELVASECADIQRSGVKYLVKRFLK